MRTIFILNAFIFLVASSCCFAKDMILTTLDNQKILLREDNTWVFQDGKKREIEKDFTVPVSGGKVVLVSADGTWGYVEKEIPDERVLIPAESVTGKGHSLHSDVAVATAQAQKQALSEATSRMKNALKKMPVDQKKIPDCVKRVEKDIDKKEDFIKGKGWDVTIVIKLDRGSILAVADCASKDKAKEKSDSTASTKTAPQKKNE